MSDIPDYRYPSQLYVFAMFDPPTFSIHDLPSIPRNYFNWTLTYRSDSDIHLPYGRLRVSGSKNPMTLINFSSPVELSSDLIEIISAKSKQVAWFASRCSTPSRRDDLVWALQKFIKIDIYGDCGPLKCPKSQDGACRRMLTRDYKFYLALENSLCRDYVTEKFWEALSRHVVPIVLRRRDYTKIAPPHSFIAVDDYDSVGHLAIDIEMLSADNTKYAQYFAWKMMGMEVLNGNVLSVGPQALCQKLWTSDGQTSQPKSYDNIDHWWTSDVCSTNFIPEFLKI